LPRLPSFAFVYPSKLLQRQILYSFLCSRQIIVIVHGKCFQSAILYWQDKMPIVRTRYKLIRLQSFQQKFYKSGNTCQGQNIKLINGLALLRVDLEARWDSHYTPLARSIRQPINNSSRPHIDLKSDLASLPPIHLTCTHSHAIKLFFSHINFF